MNIFYQFILVIYLVTFVGVDGNYMDYYWRDLRDDIPEDAFPAIKKRKVSYFIGRTFFENKEGDVAIISPTLIKYPRNKSFEILFSGKNLIYNIHYKITKILCGVGGTLGWLKTDLDRIRTITHCQVVVVGYNKDAVLTVISYKEGKKRSDVFPFFDREQKGYKQLQNKTFQILTNDCEGRSDLKATYKTEEIVHRAAVSGFFWRDYVKKIPVDAFKAGKSFGGRDVYVGQLFHQDHKVVTVIPLQNGQYISQYGLFERPDQYDLSNVQILCSGEMEKLKWVPIRKFDFKGENCTLVRGGAWKVECPTFIGRSFYNGAVHLDNVFEHQLGMKPLHDVCLPDTSEEAIMTNFDVLTFDCDL